LEELCEPIVIKDLDCIKAVRCTAEAVAAAAAAAAAPRVLSATEVAANVANKKASTAKKKIVGTVNSYYEVNRILARQCYQGIDRYVLQPAHRKHAR
jgi:peptidyl-tRNA hydrolase